MKTVTLVTGLALSLTLSLSLSTLVRADDNGRIADLVGKAAGQSSEGYAKSVIRCARDIVENRKGGIAGVEIANQFLIAVQANRGNRTLLADLDKTCHSALISLFQSSVTRDEQFAYAKGFSNTSCASHVMLEDFIKPRVTCTKGGVGASAAVFLALEAQLDGAKCESSDGKSWLEISLGAGIGMGIGLEVDLNGQKDLSRGRKNASHNPLSVSTTNSGQGGSILGIRMEGAETHVNGHDDTEVRGVGLALGGSATKNGHLNIEVLPLGTNDNRLYDRLMRDDAQACRELAANTTPTERRDVRYSEQATQNSDALAILDSDTSATKQLAAPAGFGHETSAKAEGTQRVL